MHNTKWVMIIRSVSGLLSIWYPVSTLTTHLLSIEHADWLNLHDMFKARDAKSWQRWFPVGFPVRVCALNLLFINILYDIVARIESRYAIKMLKQNISCWSINSFDLSLKKLHSRWRARAIFPRKIERINRPTRHVLLQNQYWPNCQWDTRNTFQLSLIQNWNFMGKLNAAYALYLQVPDVKILFICPM